MTSELGREIRPDVAMGMLLAMLDAWPSSSVSAPIPRRWAIPRRAPRIGSPMVDEARACADLMEAWRKANDGAWRRKSAMTQDDTHRRYEAGWSDMRAFACKLLDEAGRADLARILREMPLPASGGQVARIISEEAHGRNDRRNNAC